MKRINVIGCGIVGLTTAICLAEAGYKVKILAKDFPPNTTSDWAAAIWFPYQVSPQHKVLRWGNETYAVFQTQLNVQGAGVGNTELIYLTEDKPDTPWWSDAVPSYTHATAEDLPHGYEYGYKVTVPVCDTGLYLLYLMNKFKELGGVIQQAEITCFSELIQAKNIIINCTGLGSYSLASDTLLYPIKGQVVKVTGAEIKNSLVRDFGDFYPAYIIPRSKDIILGGTAELNNWDMSPSEDITAQILEQTKRLVPELKTAKFLEHGAGLRPARPEIRLELEMLTENCGVIHNYGHGGAGFTVSWGCASEVLKLTNEFFATFNN